MDKLKSWGEWVLNLVLTLFVGAVVVSVAAVVLGLVMGFMAVVFVCVVEHLVSTGAFP